MARSDQASNTLRDYWRVILLRRRLVVAIVIVCTLLAWGRAKMQPDVYEATASMMYKPPPNVSSAASGNSTDLSELTVDVQSVTNTIASPAVRERASSFFSASDRNESYSVSANVAVPANASSGTAVLDVVDITAQAGSPEVAAAAANAYAKAVIQLRKEDEQSSWRAAEGIIQRQLDLYKTPEAKRTSDYAMLSVQLRNLQIAEASANGDFQVIVPATPPSAPSSPKPVKSAIFGFVAGLFLGIVSAFVISQFDTRVRSHRELSDVMGLPVIGRVPRMPQLVLQHGGLVASTDPGASASEALRVLRRNLEWTGVDGPLKSLLMTSLVKGEGKSLTLCNLAVTLARAGSKVILVDADLRNPKVHRIFSLPNPIGLSAAVLGKTNLQAALREVRTSGSSTVFRTVDGVDTQRPRGDSGSLLVLTSGPLPPNPGEVVASRGVARVLEELTSSDADYVLVDTPPLLAFGDAGALSSIVDGVMVAVRIDKARLPVLEEGREAIDALPRRPIGLVVVGERVDHTQYASYSSYATGHE